jgi:hypothetical protein
MPETGRILAIPRQKASPLDLTPDVALTGKFQLRPVQSAALHQIRENGGLVGPIGVGHGKFLISVLAGTVLEAERPVLLVPPALVGQTHQEIERFRDHFDIPPNLKVVAYSQLSVATGTDLLDRLRPDLIVADEAHSLRHRSSARTKRLLRYFRAHPETAFVALSGTLTAKGLKEYAHLIELALRERSPIPLNFPELSSWAACIDVAAQPNRMDYATFRPILRAFGEAPPEETSTGTKELCRRAFQNRLRSSPGVITTEESAVDCSLYLRRVRVPLPPVLQAAIDRMEKLWVTPGGEEITDALTFARFRRHLHCGFYYRWVWPEGVPDVEWLDARSEWHQEVRRVLRRSREGLDSPLLVSQWAESEECKDKKLLVAWDQWSAVRHRPAPPVEAVWLSKYLIEDACKRAITERHPLLIWADHRAVLDAFEQDSSLPVFRPGCGKDIAAFTGKTGAVLSRRMYGTGRNLQDFHRNLILSFPPNASTIEQLIGRTHRPGQENDSVWLDYYANDAYVGRDVAACLDGSRYIEHTTGTRQKILSATWVE